MVSAHVMASAAEDWLEFMQAAQMNAEERTFFCWATQERFVASLSPSCWLLRKC